MTTKTPSYHILREISPTDGIIELIKEINKLAHPFLQDIVPNPKIEGVREIHETQHQVRKPKVRVPKSKPTITKKRTTNHPIVTAINKITEDEWYLVKPMKKEHDKYYSAICMLLDDDYSAYSLRERDRIIKTLKNKMIVDLVECDLYRLYGYHHVRTFKKSDLEDGMVEGKLVDVTRRFLSDYIDLNIYVICEETGKGLIYREDIKNTLSVVLIRHETTDTYSALLSNSGNHFIHPAVLQEIKKLYPIVEPSTTKKVKKSKSPTKPRFKSLKISDMYKNDKFKLYSIGRYTLAELQEIAETYDIPKYNIRVLKSGEKRIKDKTKRELYTLITEKCGLK